MSKQNKKENENNPFNKDMDLDSTVEKQEEMTEETVQQETVQQETEEAVEEVSQDSAWQEKYEQLNNQYIRLAADFDNFRKRQAQERENLLKYGAEETLKKLIEVLDNFDRGQNAIEKIEDCQ